MGDLMTSSLYVVERDVLHLSDWRVFRLKDVGENLRSNTAESRWHRALRSAWVVLDEQVEIKALWKRLERLCVRAERLDQVEKVFPQGARSRT